MIIKLDQTYSFARQEEKIVTKKLTFQDRVKADRLVMLFLLMITVIGAVVFS